jgi:hypothetical protein
MVMSPTRRATYMYQRRRVADAPSSPTTVRSRVAILRWKAQIPSRTRVAHAPCVMTSHSGPLLQPVPVITGQVSVIGRRRWPIVKDKVNMAPIDVPSKAQ